MDPSASELLSWGQGMRAKMAERANAIGEEDSSMSAGRFWKYGTGSSGADGPAGGGKIGKKGCIQM